MKSLHQEYIDKIPTELFKKLTTFSQLQEIFELYPSDAHQIMQLILTDKNKYQNLIQKEHHLIWILKKFPQDIVRISNITDDKMIPNVKQIISVFSSSLSFTSPLYDSSSKFLFVSTEHYVYLSKKNISTLQGFITENVIECVFGIITSDQGCAAFHFFRGQDPQFLIKKISEDFEKCINANLYLYGGYFACIFFPWKKTEPLQCLIKIMKQYMIKKKH